MCWQHSPDARTAHTARLAALKCRTARIGCAVGAEICHCAKRCVHRHFCITFICIMREEPIDLLCLVSVLRVRQESNTKNAYQVTHDKMC